MNPQRFIDSWLEMAALIGGAFISEDLTCIAAGLLIRYDQLNWLVGTFSCFLGIFVSDLGLWLVGRVLGRRVLGWSWLNRHLPAERLQSFEQWFMRHGRAPVIAARFLPGMRLPLYVAAGLLRQRLGQFALWTFLAALVWTPLLVIAVILGGEAIVEPLTAVLGRGWPALLLGAVALFIGIRAAMLACTAVGRARLWARVSRLWRWEFWPSWLFYLPVLPWLGYLSLRYRGLTTWTAANPGIPHGGVVGESKYEILTQLPRQWIVPTIFLAPGDVKDRLGEVRRNLAGNGWKFPLILKPDASQRGAGVKLVRDLVEVEKYLQNQPAAVVTQTYHPGPYEAGIFYYRLPGEVSGRIFSITDKHFPELVGDGRSTLEELIWRHPRYRMQARTFLKRHEAQKDRILPAGERLTLALAGNHCQGTMFRDGAQLITPELEGAVDTIAQQFDGFFIGRFDVRYTDVEAFKAGEDLAIVELNGVTSESTNIYDPSRSLISAYGTLYRQWGLLYKIGHANRQRGHEVTAAWQLLKEVVRYYWRLRVDPLAD